MGISPATRTGGVGRPGMLGAALLALSSIPLFANPAAPFSEGLLPFLDRHCVECHDDEVAKGELDLTGLSTDFSRPGTAEIWTRIHDRVAAGEMPPEKKPRPEAADSAAALEWLAGQLHAADLGQRQVVLRRLNRAEYQNTIRDLLSVDLPLASFLPEDQVAHGFDNIGEALAVSPELLKAYLDTADIALADALDSGERPEKISRTIRITDYKPLLEKRPDLYLLHDDGVQMISPALLNVAGFRAPRTGRYRASIHARAVDTGGSPVVLAVFAGDVISRFRPTRLLGYYEIPAEDTVIEIEEQLERADSFKIIATRECLSPGAPESAGILLERIDVEGPLLEAWPPPARRRWLADLDPDTAILRDARDIFERFLPRAFRRPVTAGDIRPFTKLVESQLGAGASFEVALRAGLQAALCAPDFLYLKETGRPGDPIDDFEIASRLSYFLWSSTPDRELLAQAYLGKLRDPAELTRQVERMLAHPKASAFTENFTGQWLKLREIDFTTPDSGLFPEFDELLKVSFVDESQAFFDEILEKNLSVLNFVDSDFVMINEPLAAHYGIENVRGLALRPVSLPDGSPRGGVITQGSVLKVTANGTNTSPVRRGIWMLENILGIPTPPPPGNVSAIEPDIRGAKTIREEFEKHRTLASCRTCHARIDPLGYALENFDAVGGWRDHYPVLAETGSKPGQNSPPPVHYLEGPAVEAHGELWTGAKFHDIRGLKKHLLEDETSIAECVTAKVLTYALGRSLGFSDRPAVREIVTRIRDDNYGLRSLVLEIVQSEPFLTR